MNFDKLMPVIMTLIIGAAAVGKLDSLQQWIWKSQAQLLYESRASNRGSPSIFKETLDIKRRDQKHGKFKQ